jgi:hypothetical protein
VADYVARFGGARRLLFHLMHCAETKMPISDAAINTLPLGKDVYDDLTYCMQEWQNAGFEAVQGLPDPEEEDTTVNWVICLIGNLAWAATVFFPPTRIASALIATQAGARPAIAGGLQIVKAELALGSALAPSTATKAVSMLGATLAADVVGRLRKLGGDLRSPMGKAFLADYLGNQVPDLLKQYAADANPWVRNDLTNHLIAQYALRFHPDPNESNDAGFTAFYNSVAGAEERRRYVWQDYVFPDDATPFDNKPDGKGGGRPGGRGGLKQQIAGHLESALKDYDQQWKKYQSDLHNYVNSIGDWRVVVPARADYLRRHPFDPVLKYSGVPDKLQAQQQSNQRKLSNLVKASD